jgi:hypothetical protein
MLQDMERRATVRELEAAVLDALTDADRFSHATYSRAELLDSGCVVEVAGVVLSADDDFLLAFVDEAPGGNWTHPCRYLVATTTGVTSTPAQWPPVMGRLPAPWALLHQGQLVEEWQLLPLDDHEPKDTDALTDR